VRNVRITKKITIGLTADDWQLYGDEGGVAREMTAFEMNRHIENILNAHPPKDEAVPAIADILKAYRSFGAYDTEGMLVAEDVIEVFYEGESK
jgi:hypothetical protein